MKVQLKPEYKYIGLKTNKHYKVTDKPQKKEDNNTYLRVHVPSDERLSKRWYNTDMFVVMR